MAAAGEIEARAALYQSLMWRNRIVGLLRFALPLIGTCILLYLLLQIAIDAVANRFGISNIHIDRDNLVVETPHVTQTGPDGTLYALEALAAKVAAGDPDRIDMQDMQFSMTPLGRPAMQAQAAAASFKVHDQLLDVPGVMKVTSSDGMNGTVSIVHADLIARQMVADGAVDMVLRDGSTLKAQGMTFDGKTGLYTFSRVEVTLPQLPGEAP